MASSTRSLSANPRIILIGAGQVVPSLEEDLLGKDVGYNGTVSIPLEKAYDEHDPEKVEIVSLNRLKEERPYVGLRVSLNGENGMVTRIIDLEIYGGRWGKRR